MQGPGPHYDISTRRFDVLCLCCSHCVLTTTQDNTQGKERNVLIFFVYGYVTS